MAKLFGTDGVRGVANTELTCDIAFKLGQAAVEFLGKTIVVGKDTRLSGDMLGNALSAGIMSMGGNVLDAGIIPTPGVAYLVRELHAEGGIVISASHNPPEYNGIKFFDRQGFKLTEEAEAEIESFVLAGGADPESLPSGDAVGVVLPVEDALASSIFSVLLHPCRIRHSTFRSLRSHSILVTVLHRLRLRQRSRTVWVLRFM